MERPSHSALKEVIRQYKGNISHIAEHFDRSRPTIYLWIYQHGLAEFAGIVDPEALAAADDAPSPESTLRQDCKDSLDVNPPMGCQDVNHTNKYVKPQSGDAPIFGGVEPQTVDAKTQRGISFAKSWWRWVRVYAAQTDKTASEVVQEALIHFREKVERETRGRAD
jgi:hypothetical protein